jgi:hypothetical protein
MRNFLVECHSPILFDYLKDFCVFVCERLGIADCPPINFVCKTGSSSFGNYRPSTKAIEVATDGRHVADILRTLAHELVHEAQHMDGEPAETLEELEYEANGLAGMLMREYNKLHPELYEAEDAPAVDELDDTGNPGIAMGNLENAGVTVDAFQTPTYESGLDDGQPMRPPYPVEMAEELLTELSPKTLGRYKRKASAEIHPSRQLPDGTVYSAKHFNKRYFRGLDLKALRQNGIDRATKKLQAHYNPDSLQEESSISIQSLVEKHKKSFEYLSAQLKKGSKVECEHTKDDAVARKIALDHLNERPDYYEQLEKVEKAPLKEEAPVNAAGSGNVAGIGIGPQGEPGLPQKKTKLIKRKTFTQFRTKMEE